MVMVCQSFFINPFKNQKFSRKIRFKHILPWTKNKSILKEEEKYFILSDFDSFLSDFKQKKDNFRQKRVVQII